MGYAPPSLRRTVLWLLGLTIAAAAGGACFQFVQIRPRSEPVPGLMIAPSKLDFGDVWESSNFQWDLPIQNTSDAQILVQSFASSCYCTSIDPPSLSIAPNATGTVHVNLDLTHLPQENEAGVTRPFEVHISPILLKDGKLLQYPAWALRGRVRSAFTIEPTHIEFWQGIVRRTPHPSRRVRLSYQMPIRNINTKYDPSFFAVKVISQKILQEGKNAGVLYLKLFDGDYEENVPIEVSYYGIAAKQH